MKPKTILLFADARESIRRILAGLSPETEPVAPQRSVQSEDRDLYARAGTATRDAQKIIFVPG